MGVERCKLLFGHQVAAKCIERFLIDGPISNVLICIIFSLCLNLLKRLFLLNLLLGRWLIQNSIKALYLMLSQRLLPAVLLYESNHSFITMLVKSLEVMIFYRFEIRQILQVCWLVRDFPGDLFEIYYFVIFTFFYCVLEVCDESEIF